MKIRKDRYGLYIRHPNNRILPTATPYRPGDFLGYSHALNTTAGPFEEGDNPKTKYIKGTPLIQLISEDGEQYFWGHCGRTEGDMHEAEYSPKKVSYDCLTTVFDGLTDHLGLGYFIEENEELETYDVCIHPAKFFDTTSTLGREPLPAKTVDFLLRFTPVALPFLGQRSVSIIGNVTISVPFSYIKDRSSK